METFEARLASFDTVLNPAKRRGSSAKSIKPITWPHSSPSPAEVGFLLFLDDKMQNPTDEWFDRSWRMRAPTMSPMRRTPITRDVFSARVPSMDGKRKITR